jgi:hypothetical protein
MRLSMDLGLDVDGHFIGGHTQSWSSDNLVQRLKMDTGRRIV